MLKTRVVCFAVMTFWAAHGQELQEANPLTGALKSLTSDAMEQYKLKSLLVQVRCNGHNLYTEAEAFRNVSHLDVTCSSILS